MRSLPFYMDDLNGGFMKMDGILRVENKKLIIEYQKKDALIEAYKSALLTAEIDLSDIDLFEFKKGLFSNKLIIHGKRPAIFGDFPGSDLTQRVLKVKRKHRDIAANISSRMNIFLSEEKLKQMESDAE